MIIGSGYGPPKPGGELAPVELRAIAEIRETIVATQAMRSMKTA
jgi:hypothetical protein